MVSESCVVLTPDFFFPHYPSYLAYDGNEYGTVYVMSPDLFSNFKCQEAYLIRILFTLNIKYFFLFNFYDLNLVKKKNEFILAENERDGKIKLAPLGRNPCFSPASIRSSSKNFQLNWSKMKSQGYRIAIF